MNKADKRQRSIRNKLMAAVAMLLVASIMTVTTTYAWFTLSTAPEVQGITTTVGANGNLEIALSYPDGDYNKITSEVGDANDPSWVTKNLTWGNLLDLSDPSYRLEEMTLLPSRLNLTAGTDTSPNTLKGNPLQVPVYGSDGRISALNGDKVFTGTYMTLDNGASGFMVNPLYGVRAVGTSSSMSPDAIAFNSALSAMGSSTTTANSLVTAALNNYGSALADMAVKHASAGGTDNNDYVTYVPKLQAISEELVKASAEVEKALYNALLALTKSAIPVDFGQLDSQITDPYTYIKTQMENETPLDSVWSSIPTNVWDNKDAKVLNDAYTKWKTLDTNVNTNYTSVHALPTEDKDGTTEVTWIQISEAMRVMVDTGKVTISGYPMDEVMKNIAAIMGTAGGIRLELGTGTGVIADFGELTGDILSSVTLSDGLFYTSGTTEIGLGGVKVNIVTNSEPEDGALLIQSRTLITALGVKKTEGEQATSLIDVIYGYMIDFAFRTNAANSNLLLQTEGVQRIYGDSQNLATMGGGSTMTFSGKFLNLDSLVSMMSGIRVVFTDTKGEEIYGIAKVNFDEHLIKMNITPVTRELKENNQTSTENNVETVVYGNKVEFTDGTAEDKNVLLSANNDGVVTLSVAMGENAEDGVLYLGDHQYLVRETMTKTDASGVETTYERWTVKTAVTYTVTETTTTKTPDGTNEDGTTKYKEESKTDTVTYELLDADKNVIFYDHKDIDGDGDDDYYLDVVAAKDVTVTTGTKGGVAQTMTDDLDSVHVYYEELAALIADAGTTVQGQYGEADANGVQTKVDKTYKTTDEYAADITAAHKEPTYFHVYDQDLTLAGPLNMFDYSVENGELVFTTPLAQQTITGLDQNVPTGITAMVYLDGDYVDNSDVTNSADGVSNTGALNLQFASSANLVPMQNSDLKNGETITVAVTNDTDAQFLSSEDYAVIGKDYRFAMDKNYSVKYTFLDKDGKPVGTAKEMTGTLHEQTFNGVTYKGYVFTIPGSEIKADTSLTIEVIKPAATNP